MNENLLFKVLDHIIEKSKFLKKLGYVYIFSLTPCRSLQLSCTKDQKDIILEKKISEYLTKNGVHYIDMCKIFRNYPNQKELYFSNDSHINPAGAQLIANEITYYINSLNEKSVISLLNLHAP